MNMRFSDGQEIEGRGWVHMRNKTALPDMPNLNQSLSEHIALPSVYHQLHCLVCHVVSDFVLPSSVLKN